MMYAKQFAYLLLLTLPVQAIGQEDRLETLIVTGQRTAATAQNQGIAVTRIDQADIAANGHNHFNELANRSPGTWISRGSGQEQLTAIRSPVLTGAGSCGAFLILEDSIPIRPAGFCNVNELFEINTAQASAVEIARGPVSAAWGANGLHGAINVLMSAPHEQSFLIGAGPDDFYRAQVATPLPLDGGLLINVDHDGGFRADSGYDQGKLNLMFGGGNLPTIRIAATRLQQETAGFVLGENAYRIDSLRKTNPNPEAYRDADAERISVSWEGDWALTVYARHSRMQFLQHFLPGQPLERNGQHSLGLTTRKTHDTGAWRLTVGLDAELARGRLTETQNAPTAGSVFLQETRPAGTHYDYEAESSMLGLWFNASRQLSQSLTLQLAGRVETLGFDYNNHAATGNLRDDGSACGFGGCLYNRPADRSDRFDNFAPRIAVNGELTTRLHWWAQVASGFRTPQATELYRLQRGQETAQLASERLNSGDSGLRYIGDRLSVETAIFLMRKKHFIFRDADGLNVSDGRTRHHGLETSLRWQPLDTLVLELSASQALHRYDFDRNAAAGEIISRGLEIDTAPAHLSSGRLRWTTTTQSEIELEWLHTGNYAMNAANTVRYPGHDLINLRYKLSFNRHWAIYARLMNVSDTRYAERADFAFGQQRFFPGRQRSVYVDLQWRP